MGARGAGQIAGGANITFAIDARGAEAGVEQRIEAMLRRTAPALIEASKNAVMSDFRNKGVVL
ncbi:MAG: hypothetical protein Tsb0010_10580 [Parvularculaceae bacterium]